MIVRAEGFAHFTSATDWNAKGHRGGSSWAPTGGRGDRGVMTVSGSASNDAWMVLPSGYTTLIHHEAFYASTLANSSPIAFASTTYPHILIRCESNGSMSVYRAGFFASTGSSPEIDYTDATLLDVTANALVRPNTWHQIQVKCTVHASAGEVTIKLDGVQVFTFTGNTYNSYAGTTSMTQIGMGNNDGTSSVKYSDVVTCNGSGGIHDDFLGDCAVYESVNPVDGDLLQWTRSSGAGTWSSHVDDNPQDGDTTYLSSDTVTQRVCFSFPVISSSIGTILAVKETVCHRKDEPTTALIELFSRSDDDVNHDGPIKASTESYIFDERIYDQDLKDSSSWTVDKVNATQLGVVNVAA